MLTLWRSKLNCMSCHVYDHEEDSVMVLVDYILV